jgi:hypothetical protein
LRNSLVLVRERRADSTVRCAIISSGMHRSLAPAPPAALSDR